LDDHTVDAKKGSPFTPLTTNNPWKEDGFEFGAQQCNGINVMGY